MLFRVALLMPIVVLSLSGCVVRTALDVATLPVKAASRGVDLSTTSQSEADQKRGREIRKREERLGELQREFDRLRGDCLDGDVRACERQASVGARIDAMLPTVPYEPD